MAMHAVHKILASAAGKPSVSPGEIVNAQVNIAGINDIYLLVLHSFNEMGGSRVWDPDKIVFFFDHNAPSSSIQSSENQKSMREFAQIQGIRHLFEINEGVCHMVLPEAGLVRPGEIIVITDSHTTTHGAFGAFGTGVGSTDLATILITGKLWFRVPKVIRLHLEGVMPDNVTAKDAALYILGKLGADFAVYRLLEFSGPAVEDMPIEERMVLCNMAVEMGAKAAYVQPDQKVMDYLADRTNKPFTVYQTDSDFQFESEFRFNLENMAPQVAAPPNVDNVKTVEEIEGIPIDQVFIGSCTGGKLTDIKYAARILKGQKVASSTRLLVNPASKEVLKKAVEEGYFQILIEAGATMVTPGCGACCGLHAGLLAAGEKCASTSNRNFPGRMGSSEAEIYLVSPFTAAATAIAGKLTQITGANS
jgi:homoaconitate hydratase family protein